ncbi:helix-turn-helix domain-containing protein [Nocardia brasiliensis]|uniref:helix-turn-helix domain-containing protein n=1 Tax=Nocardia brasiliensis TaxID=37326 RepID=UPI00245869B4|nr:helix-turn-helix domain-containing protein [Nocardia brasiliensis]
MAKSETDGQLLRSLREQAGLSQAQLSDAAHYDKGYISRVENDKQSLSESLAEACDAALETGGQLAARARANAQLRGEVLPVAQLPAAPAGLVGREGPLERLAELLTCPQDQPGLVPVVCVDGPPGVGKTALALTYAHSVVGRYPGGALFADLRGYGTAGSANSTEILDGFLRALGAHPNRIPADLDGRSALFRSMVHGRGILVVLDNAQSSGQVRPLLPGSPDCGVLVTSRVRLTGLFVGASATAVTLNPLRPDDAQALLERVIGRRTGAETAAVPLIARRCGYLPLALRIAAVRIATYSHRSISDLAEDLAAEHRRLDVLIAGDAAELEVRGVFSWSYQALPTEAGRMFRLLGLHPGTTFSLEAAAALAGVPNPVAARLMDILVMAHLVEETGRHRYRLHDLLRVYAAELVRSVESGAGCDEAARRLVDWCLASLDAAVRVLTPGRPHPALPPLVAGVQPVEFSGDYELALDWCDTELSSIVGATRLAADYEMFDRAWQLPVRALYYLLIRRPWDEWIATSEIGVAAAQTSGNINGYGEALINLAAAHLRRGDYDIAEQQLHDALDACSDPYQRGWALAGLAFTCLGRENYQPAIDYLHQMADSFIGLGENYGVATAYANLGEAYREVGELEQAWVYGQRSVELFNSNHDRQGAGYALSRLARTALHRGDSAVALDLCEQALAANRETGDRWAEADTLDVRGQVLRTSGETQAATRALTAALAIFNDGLDDHRADLLRAQLDVTADEQ